VGGLRGESLSLDFCGQYASGPKAAHCARDSCVARTRVSDLGGGRVIYRVNRKARELMRVRVLSPRAGSVMVSS